MSVPSKKDLGGSRKAVVHLIDSWRQGAVQKAAERNRQQVPDLLLHFLCYLIAFVQSFALSTSSVCPCALIIHEDFVV